MSPPFSQSGIPLSEFAENTMYDGRKFKSVSNSPNGEVSGETIF
jgi:hypothetical protein